MFFLSENCRHPEFRQGLRDQFAVAPGIAAWGLMTGVAMVKSGLSMVEALLMSVLVFAGSAQLAVLYPTQPAVQNGFSAPICGPTSCTCPCRSAWCAAT